MGKILTNSKTKPIQKAEFESLKNWWNNRSENEQAWKVSIDELIANGYNLDIKNPCVKEEEISYSTQELLVKLKTPHKFFPNSWQKTGIVTFYCSVSKGNYIINIKVVIQRSQHFCTD